MLREISVLSSSVTLAEELEAVLSDEQVGIEQTKTGESAIRRALCGCASALLVDEDPPDMTAGQLVRKLRNTSPGRDALIVLLSSRTTEIARVVAFELGADDYITKPIGVRELGLRLSAVLRRHPVEGTRHRAVRVGPFVIDPATERATCSGETLRLTTVEFRLLEHLVQNAGEVQDRRELLQRVWRWCDEGDDRAVGSRTVDTHVKRLRSKLGEASEFIETIRGVGYRFRMAS